MGVMRCDRKDCENIMCDTYIQEIGYVCLQCQVEFKEYLCIIGINDIKESELIAELQRFMDTTKGDFNKIDVEYFFYKHRSYL